MHAFARHGDAVLVAWVLMPDHAHWLLQLGCKESLSQAVVRLKATTARRINQACGTSGHVWSRGFHDRALRREENLLTAARYIIANPVRAGLVARVADYPYWNCIYL
jgi:REP element-mobilizing transposase RayT